MEGFFLNDAPPGGGETLEKLRAKIDPFFEILAENPKGTHVGGRTLELDAIGKPKPALLKDGFADIKVGFSFRNPLSGVTAVRDLPKKGKELIDLSHARWGDFGTLPLILVYPGFFAHMRNDQRQKMGESAGLFERMVGLYNIGEIKPEAKNLVISILGARYWDSVFGVSTEREFHFTPVIF
jgi:hypothetical protein